MIFTGIQEDKSLQNTVKIFNEKYESECKKLEQRETELLMQIKEEDTKGKKKSGRPRKYKLKIPKSKRRELAWVSNLYNRWYLSGISVTQSGQVGKNQKLERKWRIFLVTLITHRKNYSDKSLKNSVIESRGILGNGVFFKILKCLSLLTKK